MTTTCKKWRLPICSQCKTGLLVVGFLAFFFLGVGGVNADLPISPNTWQEINTSPESYPDALALKMDEPLYNAIYDKYATITNPKLDSNEDGIITLDEAGNWTGKIELGQKNLTGSIRGIGYFINITTLLLYENELIGEIPSTIGNLSKVQTIHLGANRLSGYIPPEIGNLSMCSSFNIEANKITGKIPPELANMGSAVGGGITLVFVANRLSGDIPDSLINRQIDAIYLWMNPELHTPSEKPSNWTFYSVFHTAGTPEYGLNRVSTSGKYATNNPQDGIGVEYSGFMILNQDRNNDGHADLNLIYSEGNPIHGQIPRFNIDVNGDGKADLGITAINNYTSPMSNGYYRPFNQVKPLYETNAAGSNLSTFIGFIPYQYDAGKNLLKSDFKISENYPYYVEPISRMDALIENTYAPSLILELNKQTTNGILNIDGNDDGIPDVNIDMDGDGKPDYNIDYGNNQTSQFSNGIYGEDNPVQSHTPTGLNYDSNGDGRPDTNIDLNGDGIADLNIDTNGDSIPDKNIDANHDGVIDIVPTSPSSTSGGGGGGTSLKADSCPAGDLSPSYYDGTCGTTADLAPLVAAKVNILRPLISLIYITATEKEKVLVHNIITSCSVNNKKEIIKLACQELVANWDF